MGNFIIRKNYLTPFADLKELNFVNFYKGKTGKYVKKWPSGILNRVSIVTELKKDIIFSGNILEIGAGSCWFSAELSKIPDVNHIFSLDFSDRMLREVAPSIISALRADNNKIIRILGDYHKLPFDDNLFDFVVIDAALHHTNYLDIVLKEINRVLKSSGKIIAIREPIKSLIWPLKKKLSFVDRHVKEYGVIENTYHLKQWNDFFKKAGFNLTIKPIYYKGGFKETIIRLAPFRYFNGILYSRYYFIASHNEFINK